MSSFFARLLVVLLFQQILPSLTLGQVTDKPAAVALEPIITDDFAIFPVTTELQRELLQSDTTEVCVFVNGAAFREVEKIDRFLPAFEKLRKHLQELPKGNDSGVTFQCIDSHVQGEPSDALGKRLEALSKTSEEVGYYAGYLNVKWSQTFAGDFDWEKFIGKAREAVASATSTEERPLGNERIQIYPVRTILSRLMHNADCLVKVARVVTDNSRFPAELMDDLNEFIPQQDYAGHQTMLLSIKLHDSGREMVSTWIENIEGRKEFARKNGFTECNVNSSYVDERSMVINAIDTDGRPVEGVQVRLNHIYRPRGSEKTSIENQVYSTHHNGRAIMARSGESVDLRLWFTKPGLVPLFARWATDLQSGGGEIPEDFEVRLAAGTEIGGIVTNEAGAPVEGAMVDVYDATAFTPVIPGISSKVRLTRSGWLTEGGIAPITDVEGRWSLNTVPPESELVFDRSLQVRDSTLPVRLRVRHPDYAEFDAMDDPSVAGSPSLRELRDKSARVVLSKPDAKQQPANPQAYPE